MTPRKPNKLVKLKAIRVIERIQNESTGKYKAGKMLFSVKVNKVMTEQELRDRIQVLADEYGVPPWYVYCDYYMK